jgi:hypothetical protein
MEIVGNYPMRFRGCASDVARYLRGGNRLRQGREGFGWHVARLFFKDRIVNALAFEAGRGTCLQPTQLQAQSFEAGGQAENGLFAHSASRHSFLTAMDEAAQEGPRGQDNGPGAETATVQQTHAGNGAIGYFQVINLALDHLEIGLGADRGLHGLAIELPVGLGAGAANGRTLAAVEDAELNARLIRDAAHQAVQSVDFPDEMALAQSADSRIAAHFANGREAVRDQRRGHAQPGRGRCGFRPSMAPADNDDGIVSHGNFSEAPDIGQCFT